MKNLTQGAGEVYLMLLKVALGEESVVSKLVSMQWLMDTIFCSTKGRVFDTQSLR